MGPKQVQKGTVLGLSTDFMVPFPNSSPHTPNQRMSH